MFKYDEDKGQMDDLEMPLSIEILQEAIERVLEYSHPKRSAETIYIVRYQNALLKYTDFVDCCIKSGEIPDTFEVFVEKMGL